MTPRPALGDSLPRIVIAVLAALLLSPVVRSFTSELVHSAHELGDGSSGCDAMRVPACPAPELRAATMVPQPTR